MIEKFGSIHTETLAPSNDGKRGSSESRAKPAEKPAAPKATPESVKAGNAPKAKPEATTKAGGNALKLRKVPGRKSELSRALSSGASKKGDPEVVYRPKGNLTRAEVEKMFKVKAINSGNLLTGMITDLTRDASVQLVKLGEDVRAAGGTDKRSGRYGLSLMVAKAISDHFALGNIGQQMAGEQSIPLFKRWTWLQSNGFVIGDPKIHIPTQSIDKKDQKKIAAREQAFQTFEKETRPKLSARILDRIGEELDLISRWARTQTHNELVQVRIAALRQKDPRAKADPKDPQYRLAPKVDYPSGGFVAYLADELHVPDLTKDSLRQKIGALPYVPYEPVSKERKDELAAIAKQKKDAEPGVLQRKEAAQVEKTKATIERQAQLAKLIEGVQKQRDTMNILLTAFGKDVDTQKGRLKDIVDLVKNLMTAQDTYIADAQKHMPPPDTRGLLSRRVTAKEVGELEKPKLDGFASRTDDLTKRRFSAVEKRINDTIGALGGEVQKILGNVSLDTLDARKAANLISSLKVALVAIRKPAAQETPEMQQQYLGKEVVPQLRTERDQIVAVLKGLTHDRDTLRAQRDALQKGTPEFDKISVELLLCESKIQAVERERQSLESKLTYLQQLIVAPPKGTDKKGMDEWGAALRKAKARYANQPKKTNR